MSNALEDFVYFSFRLFKCYTLMCLDNVAIDRKTFKKSLHVRCIQEHIRSKRYNENIDHILEFIIALL